MIDLTIKTESSESQPRVYQEGMVDDVLKSTADIDTAAIKDAWDSGDINHALSTTNSEGIQKAKTMADALDKHVFGKMRVDNRSIVARARNSILQFPMYITQSCPVAPAQTISKLFERVYTTLVQTVLSQNQVMDEDEANNLVFLKKFHTNLKESTEDLLAHYESLVNMFYQPIDDLDAMMCESIYAEHVINENCKVIFRVVPTTDVNLIAECARGVCDPLSGFVYLQEDRKIRDTEITSQYRTVSEGELRELAMDEANLSSDERQLVETTPDAIRRQITAEMGSQHQTDISPNGSDRPNTNGQTSMLPADPNEGHENPMAMRLQQEIENAVDERLKQRESALNRLDAALDTVKQDIKDGKYKEKGYDWDGIRFRRTDHVNKKISKTLPDQKKVVNDAVNSPVILKDGDIKKMNAMLPYTIEATFRLRTKSGIDRDIKYIIGIKTVMHLIRTQDLADDLRELVTGRIKSLQKVRYKTGEISFKDYLFNTRQLKADAAKNINYNKRWLNTLKRLSDYEQHYGSFLKGPIQGISKGDVPVPNGTLILTQPDVTTLTNQTGIDLSQVSNAKRLAKSLFLIAVCIVDSSAGTMRVLFTDSDNDWDVQSLASIDAEVSKTDNSQLMRELNHIVNR